MFSTFQHKVETAQLTLVCLSICIQQVQEKKGGKILDISETGTRVPLGGHFPNLFSFFIPIFASGVSLVFVGFVPIAAHIHSFWCSMFIANRVHFSSVFSGKTTAFPLPCGFGMTKHLQHQQGTDGSKIKTSKDFFSLWIVFASSA